MILRRMDHIQNCGINCGKLASQDGMNRLLTSEYFIKHYLNVFIH